MKLLVVLLATITVCAGSAIPLVPGDNSHYVEGESRYIWMPDGDGVPHLVDLEEPVDETVLNSRNGANNQYWLFTRRNPTSAQILTNGNLNSVRNSNYNSARPLMVIIHGWNSNGNSDVNPMIRDAYLAWVDGNVIVVDWRALANSGYSTAVAGVPGIGRFLGNFLTWLINNIGGNWNNVHIVGYSLGAHVAGNAGRTVGRRASRITGLDPAGRDWRGNWNSMTGADALYVEAIHTDGGLLGIFDPIGGANFYPNGGRNPQPGCLISTCSHSRSFHLFASSVRVPYRFPARRCNNLDEAREVRCTGGTLHMGNGVLTKRGSGLYGLRTGSSWPF